jgi:hypothetical protein
MSLDADILIPNGPSPATVVPRVAGILEGEEPIDAGPEIEM